MIKKLNVILIDSKDTYLTEKYLTDYIPNSLDNLVVIDYTELKTTLKETYGETKNIRNEALCTLNFRLVSLLKEITEDTTVIVKYFNVSQKIRERLRRTLSRLETYFKVDLTIEIVYIFESIDRMIEQGISSNPIKTFTYKEIPEIGKDCDKFSLYGEKYFEDGYSFNSDYNIKGKVLTELRKSLKKEYLFFITRKHMDKELLKFPTYVKILTEIEKNIKEHPSNVEEIIFNSLGKIITGEKTYCNKKRKFRLFFHNEEKVNNNFYLNYIFTTNFTGDKVTFTQ